MSWQSYVDDHLMFDLGSGQKLSSAAIVGAEGSTWAQSASFPEFKEGEFAAILKAFEDPDVGVAALAQSGLHIGGLKYFVVQGEAGVVIRGKRGSGGVTIKKSNLSLVFGIYDEPVTPGECNIVVEKLGDYLIEMGY